MKSTKHLNTKNIKNTKKEIKKVALGLSGGVDSSVAAYLLKKQGYDVTGVYMQCWESKLDGCKADKDRKYAVEVASKLNIKFVSLDFIKEYKDKVISYFYDEYKAGRTPNPDVMCNKEIKFGLFYNWAVNNGFDYIATGHYARVEEKNNKYRLLKGVDESKDQSYFLYLLDQEKLSKTLFPLGELKKCEVRKIAKKENLPTAEREESMGICFIGEVDIKKFLKKEIDFKVGDVLYVDGTKIGKHDGVWFYTIGQRHGFRLKKYFGNPLYVIKKDIDKNILIVGEEKYVYKKEFEVTDVHWVGDAKKEDFECEVRIRHLGEIHKAKVNLPKINLEKEIFGIAPGQSCVFYNEDVVLGGGIIK